MDPNSQRANDGPKRQPDVVALSGMSLDGAGAAIPPRFERQLHGVARRRRGAEQPWVAVAKVIGIAEIRIEYGDPAAEELLRGTASVLRTSLRESDKLAPVGRGEYGIILDAPSGSAVVAGLERLVDERSPAGRPRSTVDPGIALHRGRARVERRAGRQSSSGPGLRSTMPRSAVARW